MMVGWKMEVTRKGEEMERRRRPHIQETKGRKYTGVQRAWRGKRSASRQREWRGWGGGGGALSKKGDTKEGMEGYSG